MPNDLNFDELDQAVNNYMKDKDTAAEKPADEPSSPASPAGPVMPTPAPSTTPTSDSKPATPAPQPATSAPQESSAPAAPSPSRDHLQVRSRQSLTPQPNRTHTFQDIVAPRKPSPAAARKRVQPLSDVMPPKPTSTVPTPDVTPPPEKAEKSAPAPAEEPPIATSQSELLKNMTAPESKSAPDPAPSKPTPAPKLPAQDESPEPNILSDTATSSPAEPAQNTPEAPAEKPLASPPSDISDALREDLAKSAPGPDHDEDFEHLTTSAPPHEAQPAAPKPASPKEPSPNFADGLIDPGDDPKSALDNPSASHLLPSGEDVQGAKDRPMQLFDTKQYHTPLEGGRPMGGKARGKNGWFALLALAILVAAGVAIYILYVKG